MTESAAWRVASRAVLLVFGLLFAVWLVVQLQAVLVQVLLAVILSAGMAPIVEHFTTSRAVRHWRWRPSRALVVLLLYLILFILIVSLAAAIVPPLLAELDDLIRGLPGYIAALQVGLANLPERFPFLAPVNFEQTLSQQLQAVTAQLAGLLSQALVLLRLALGLLGGALNVLFMLILAVYITADGPRILAYLVAFFPDDRQVQVERAAGRIGQRLGGWVRGQLLLSTIIGLMTFVGLTLIGVPYAYLLAIVAGIAEAIPMLGPILASVPAIIVAAFQSPTQALLTLGLCILIQQLENNLIVPRVMSRAVELHPLAVMLALLAGGELMGATGAILAVPVAAAISVIVDELRRERVQARVTRTLQDGTAVEPLSGAPEPDAPLG